MIELYYAEDDVQIADAVKQYLEERDCRVTVFSTLAKIGEALNRRVPEMVLLDWNMPDGQGEELCRLIRRTWKELPIIFLTVRGDSADVVAGFRSGADDYVVKPFELEVLYFRIKALLRRSGGASSQYLSCGKISVDRNRRQVFCDAKEVSLSAVEYQALLCLMQNQGKIVTREKLLEQVWDVNGNYVNDNTLTVTVKRLRDKLDQPRCLKTVRSVGYRMEDETWTE
ncbi:MAG: response regulator transcription factor [Bacteroidales bacterium]|nr:response regulator transcription factor [Bacteroidales bacterium]MCM1415193.1 response regulator transcription factor [bacterium]MCM1424951.1 response regulator transcription factor [bacterium]